MNTHTKKLTKAQRGMLSLAERFGGTCRVFSDQRYTAAALEAKGLAEVRGFIEPTMTITLAGLSALKDKANDQG